MDLLLKIVKMNQRSLKNYCKKRLDAYFKDVVNNKDFIYCKGDIKVLLVAHLDTVYLKPPKKINIISSIIQSPQGIGGDDRCGVYIILKLLEKGLRPSVLFTTDEEIGGIGASEFTLDVDELDVNFILQLDRRGKNDVVRYDDDNLELTRFIETFGFKETFGTFSDISIIAPYYNISAVNLSCGYYNEHRGSSEIIDFKIVKEVLNKVYKILKTPNDKKYIYKEHIYKNYKYTDYNWYDDYKDLNDKKSVKAKKEDTCIYCGITKKEADLYDIDFFKSGSEFICEDCMITYGLEICSVCGHIQSLDYDGFICENCGNLLCDDEDLYNKDDNYED